MDLSLRTRLMGGKVGTRVGQRVVIVLIDGEPDLPAL
jgi:uncharacterized protein involved in type VI secretion and phage assembly